MRLIRLSMAFASVLALASFAKAQTKFSIQNIQVNTDSTVTVTWPVLSNQTDYSVFYSDFPNGPWQVFPDSTSTAGVSDLTLSYTDFGATGAVQRFYKAVAYGPRVIMTLVIDRSQTMDPTCVGTGCSQGGLYVPNLVARFIESFNESRDQVALVSFASTAITNVAMGSPFKSNILAAVNSMLWEGGSYMHGGLSNAFAINNGVAVSNGQQAIKVVVIFTDGSPNMVENTISCPSGTASRWVFGGSSSGSGPVYFFAPNAPYTQSGQGIPYCSTPTCCGGAATYPSITGQNVTFTMPHVFLDASNRCIEVANQMRAAGMIVYAVGLNSSGLSTSDKVFLQNVANDPHSPLFNSNMPIGIAFTLGNGADFEAATRH